MRNMTEADGAYKAIKLELIRLVEEHERRSHGGLPCPLERRNAVAYFCHGLGVRGDESFFEVEYLLADYDARCPARQCPDARKTADPPKCGRPGCGRNAHYILPGSGPNPSADRYVCLVHAPDETAAFNDWDARSRFLAWEAKRAGRPPAPALPPNFVREVADAVALAVADPDDEPGSQDVAGVVRRVLGRALENAANGGEATSPAGEGV